jgi:hypothetical protein
MDLQLEWHVLAHIAGGYVRSTSVRQDYFTGERQLTLARLRHGTTADWERSVFDLLPAVAEREIWDHLARLRILADRRRLLRTVVRVEAGLRAGDLELAEAQRQLKEAAEHE